MIFLRILYKYSLPLSLPLILVGLVYWIWIVPPKYQGYSPDQPIPFSHKIHAGELQIDCKFCHATAEKSTHASVPDTATCMKCHSEVGSDSIAIQYLRSTYKNGIAMRWKKVHDLPDHVRFSHKPHIASGIGCESCHGDVKSMDKVSIDAPFNMGWCVNCHRTYSEDLDLKPAGKNHTLQLTNCSTCHY